MIQNLISDRIPYSQLENTINQHTNFINENGGILVVRSVVANSGLDTFIIVSTFKK
jgi:hypothetical protein